MSAAEEVTRVPSGFDEATGERMYETTWTGRVRRPESVPEWCAQRIAAMGVTARALPAVRAVTALLEAGEGFDVKAAGRELDEWQRHGVRTELAALLASARENYPPAGVLVQRMLRAWTRAYGDRQPVPPRVRIVAAARARRVSSMADDPPDAASVAASWARLTSTPVFLPDSYKRAERAAYL